MSQELRVVLWAPALLAMALGGLSFGCKRSDDHVGAVQHAVSTGAQGALAARPTAPRTPPAPSNTRPTASDTIPTGHPEGAGATARLEFAPDRDHLEIANTQLADHVGVTWTDREHAHVYFGQVDRQGHPEGRAVVLHTLADVEQESLGSPSVVAVPGGFGVAWVDRENGRVRFRQLDARGAPVGRASIVHEGLEDPERATLGWNGTEFAVAVQLRQGVYFARVSPAGERLGDGAILAEGARIEGVEGLAWRDGAWTVGYTVTESGQAQRRQERIGPAGAAQGARSTAFAGALLARR